MSISHGNCVAAGGVNTLRMPTDCDQSSAMGPGRIEMMGMKNTGGRLKRREEHRGKRRKEIGENQMGREKKENTFSHSLSPNKLPFPTLTSQQMPMHNHTDLTVSHRHPLSILLERTSRRSVSTKTLPDGWTVIFSYADNPLLEIAPNFSPI